MAPRRTLAVHPAALVFIIIGMGCWLIALGGVGAATDQCVVVELFLVTEKNASRFSKPSPLQWEWWGVWFEVCMLISLFVSAFFVDFHKGKQVVMAYFIMVTVILMEARLVLQPVPVFYQPMLKPAPPQGAHNFINTVFGGVKIVDISARQALAYNAGAAGFTLLCIVNFILIIILGFDKDAHGPGGTKPLLAGDGADNI